MTKKPKDDKVGPWAKEKLGALGEYLGYYTKVLKNQSRWCKGTIYIDAFAGLGRTEVRKKDKPVGTVGLFEVEARDDPEAKEFVNGSPRVALSIPDKFSRYVFIEQDPKRVEELKKLQDEFAATHRTSIRNGDANAELQSILASGIEWKSYRAVVFLDPFGMHVPWETIEAIAATKAIEVLINFPLGMAIQRLLPKSGSMSTERRQALDAFFGSPEWWDQAYQEGSDLFGPKTMKLRDSGERLLGWYCARLKAAFGYVSTARLIKNTKGGHLYYLVWAGPHEMGLKGANYILKKGEKISKIGGKKGL